MEGLSGRVSAGVELSSDWVGPMSAGGAWPSNVWLP